MDERNTKLDKVLHIIEHPEEYSPGQLEQLLADPETRELYNLICKTDSAVESSLPIDVDAEWNNFSQCHPQVKSRRHSFFGLSSRVASVTIFIATSIVALAIGITVSVNKSHNPVANAEIQNVARETPAETQLSSASQEQTDSISEIPADPVLFEDATLSEIMEMISKRYSVKIRFNNREAENLRLYYKFDPTLSLDEIISQLNTFDQIHIVRNNNLLLID